MSTNTAENTLDPQDDPDQFLVERFAGRRDVLEAIVELGVDELSDDAARILEVLDEHEPSDSGGDHS